MQAHWNVRIDKVNRTVFCAMSGIFDEESMRKAGQEIRQATVGFRGQEHVYLADMRGMKAAKAPVAALLGEAIGWTRKHGVVFCAHVSDDTVQRLQALRVARQSTAGDDITVDCASYPEAERVVREASDKLLRNEPMPSAASFVSAT